MGSSSAVFKTLTTCSLGSQLSAGMNHQLKIAKMVMAPSMTPAYRAKRYQSDLHIRGEATEFEKAHKIECFSGDGEEERRDFDGENDGVKKRCCDVKRLGEAAQLKLRRFEVIRSHS